MQCIKHLFNKIIASNKIMCTINKEEDINFIINLVTQLPISNLLVVSEDKISIKEFVEKLNESKLEILCNDIKLIYSNKGKYIDFENNYVLEESTIDTILFTSETKYDEIVSWKKFKPKFLIGNFNYSEIDYYDIWTIYRQICDEIYFEVIMPTKKIERVEWKREESGIELSVIFPVYNVAKYLKKCLDTVTSWKADYIEFLFVNDGSPDNSGEILREYSKKDSRVKVIDKENGGCASARNVGLENAKGKYIGFIDSDDFIDPNMFRELHKRALLGSYQVAYCGYNEYYENTGIIKKVTQDAVCYPYTEGVRDEHTIRKLIMYLRIAIWRGIYLKSILDNNKIRFNESFRRFDDLPFKIEVYSNVKSVVAVPYYMYYYRLERPGQDVSCSDERLYVHFDIFNYLDGKQELTENSRIRDYLQVCKLQTHLYGLEKIDTKYFNQYVKKMKKDMRRNMGAFREDIIIKAYLGNKILIRKHLINLGLGKIMIKNGAERKQRKLFIERKRTVDKLVDMY